MKPQITFYPVSNGDMTLIRLESGKHILVDINIRQPNDNIRDVAADLRDDLQVDDNGRPYVDVMVLSHPDQDHCRGFEEHFHVGPLSAYNDKADIKKIIVREMWSSPLIFRRSSKKNHKLCQDAQVWATEARRRVNRFKEIRSFGDGDRIKILGEDIDGKTDGIPLIVFKAGSVITDICGTQQHNFAASLLAPMLASDDEEDAVLGKNESSIIMNYSIGAGTNSTAVKFLSGGDAEVVIWEKIWEKYQADKSKLQYNLLSTPHHCSWHTLSCDSLSDLGDKAKVSANARSALSQALIGAIIVASCKEILNDDDNPPSFRAKQEYMDIAKNAKGEFCNTSVYLSAANPVPMIFEISEGGLKRVTKAKTGGGSGVAGGGLGSVPFSHG